jgi:hypothetical protein
VHPARTRQPRPLEPARRRPRPPGSAARAPRVVLARLRIAEHHFDLARLRAHDRPARLRRQPLAERPMAPHRVVEIVEIGGRAVGPSGARLADDDRELPALAGRGRHPLLGPRADRDRVARDRFERLEQRRDRHVAIGGVLGRDRGEQAPGRCWRSHSGMGTGSGPSCLSSTS